MAFNIARWAALLSCASTLATASPHRQNVARDPIVASILDPILGGNGQSSTAAAASSSVAPAPAASSSAVAAAGASSSTCTTSTGSATPAPSSNAGSYKIEDDYAPSDFFSKFDFFTDPDPTHGFVKYLDEGTAQGDGLIQTKSDSIVMGVDSKNMAPQGRNSVRIFSQKTYTHGLFIADISHMPGGICGTWPAFWLLGSDWPSNGEIDIVENINDAKTNQAVLHTGGSACELRGGMQTGVEQGTNCDTPSSNNAGCQTNFNNSQTYGTGFNDIQGGIYALEWTSQHINIWFFPRGSTDTPADVNSASPNPSAWPTPYVNLPGPCNIDEHFKNQTIVFDTTFCGDFAGTAWDGSTCAMTTNTPKCEDYVANNPAAFEQAFWEVRSLKVYQTQ